jgi:dihydroorotase
MSSLLLKGARIVDPSQKLDGNRDLLVEDGKIAAIGTDIGPGHVGGNGKRGSETKVLDVSGKVVVPGLIDMHTHLREPGYEYKETVHTGSRAAVTGGFTAIACMPNTEPINDNRSVTEFILRRAKECDLARVNPVAAISKGSAGQILAELGDLRDAGAVGYSDDGTP